MIELNTIRKQPFNSGYRPSFSFVPESYTVGKINLIDKEDFLPGERGEVEISFLSTNLLGENFGVGSEFTFGESTTVLGTGKVLDILNLD